MTVKAIVAIAGIATAMPLGAFAQSASTQSADARYCDALIEVYRDSVAKTADPAATVPVAISKCQSGDTAAGIPVLEKALTDARVTLPPRH